MIEAKDAGMKAAYETEEHFRDNNLKNTGVGLINIAAEAGRLGDASCTIAEALWAHTRVHGDGYTYVVI